MVSKEWLRREAGRSLEHILPRLEKRFTGQVETGPDSWRVFVQRLEANFEKLFRLYFHLYGERCDFFYHLENLLSTTARMWYERSADLKNLDAAREADPYWFHSHKMVGGVCYVDLFAGDLNNLRTKIPYFRELGLTYLHLMPLFKVPGGENDGGYAVSSYREVHPSIGTMTQLADLAFELRKEGISLVLDLVFNHTSDEHEWALRAIAGDPDYRDFYWIFPDRSIPDAYEAHLREIFPDEHPGAFTFHPEMNGWVWTTFHIYQWDLNYANPVVFNHMVEEMLFLANVGVEVLRLDAVAFTWKKLGTNCENLPEAHMLIQAFNMVTRMAAPAMLFKSEAIVHPEEVIKYISTDECQLSYNPLLMALLWNSLATREVKLLKLALRERFKIDPECAWVNYVRCHDDIGWTFSDEDAARLGINGYDHRRFLNNFYTGRFPGSFGRGLPFQVNPKTGDTRISGTCASLAGLEKALKEETEAEVELAIRRILLIHGVILTIGGIPLIYLGDEIGILNDYSFRDDPTKMKDSRWVHRPCMDWEAATSRYDPSSLEGRVFQGLRRLIQIRKDFEVFSGGDMEVIDLENEHVLGCVRIYGSERVLVFANFTEREQIITSRILRIYGLGYSFTDLIGRETVHFDDLRLEPYQFICLK